MEASVLISELAELTGVSARALRHYEDRAILVPARNSNGYREYSEPDVSRVAQIRVMISAGLSISTIQRYLDCVRTGNEGVTLEMCPDLRTELDSLANDLNAKQTEIHETQQRLRRLTSA